MFDGKIETLLAVVGEGSYNKAARKLNLTQPAVTHHIKKLEEEFDCKLVFRDKSGLRLTPEGKILVKYARRTQALYAACRQSIEDVRSRVSHFNVGLTHSAGENVLPQVLATLCTERPEIHVNITMDTTQKLVEKLKAYELDFAFVEGPNREERLCSMLLDTDYLCLVVSPMHRFARRAAVSLAELKNQRLILRTPRAGTRILFEDYLKANGQSIDDYNVMMEIDNISTIKELVAMDMGLSVIAHSACREEERTGKLVVVPIETMQMVREVNILYHRDFTHVNMLEQVCAIYHRV